MHALRELEARTSSSWSHIRAGREQSQAEYAVLADALKPFPTVDASVVVVGSLARQEFAPGSDIDWTMLLDGITRPEHVEVANEVRNTLDHLDRKQPGREGTFGTLASSHDLVHHIGGQDDTNANTTRRILLLIESIPLGLPDAHERVLNNILSRYLDEDRGLWFGSSQYKVPRFLLNDVARYWRTMAVDFAYKQRTRPDGGFALRNFKLRLSRKLLFLAGMIACFDCHLGFGSDEERKEFYTTKQVPALIARMRTVFDKPPLEVLAGALLPHPELDLHSKKLFDSYDEFLSMLSDETPLENGLTIRKHLDKLTVDQLSDPVAKHSREVAHNFMDAIRILFLTRETDLGILTIKYGVF
jgi:predicted nucleotidyltransferase